MRKKVLVILGVLLLIISISLFVTAKIISDKNELQYKKTYQAYTLLYKDVDKKIPVDGITLKSVEKLEKSVDLVVYKEKKKSLATTVPSSLLLITIINQISKSIFKRPRPLGYRLIEITGYSFPSGHSVASMAFYGFLIYIIFNLVKNKILRNILITLNVLIIFLIGISRVYLGVHYLSDVITGYSISLIYIIILTKVLKNLKIFP